MHVKEESVQPWAVLLEAVWTARNKAVFNGELSSHWKVMEQARECIAEYNVTTKLGCVSAARPVPVMSRWSKPEVGFIKINCDAAVHAQKGNGVGCVAWDEEGQLCFIASRSVREAASVEVVEAEAIWWVVMLAQENGLSHVIIESDCMPIVTMLNGKKHHLGEMGRLIDQIRREAGKLSVCRWNFVGRKANDAAHIMAGVRHASVFFSMFDFSFPIGLKDVIDNELM